MSDNMNRELSIEDLDNVTGGGELGELVDWLKTRPDIIKEIKRLIDSGGKEAACTYLVNIIVTDPRFGEGYAGYVFKLVSLAQGW